MFLLARAQALSGRPGDALVMLGRLADLGVPVDVTIDDFRTVRLLPGWAALEARLAGTPAPSAPPAATPPPAAAATPPPAPSAAPVAPAAEAPAAPAAPAAAATGESWEFEAPGIDPDGLAHDAVSRRFVLSDRKENRLIVIDEISPPRRQLRHGRVGGLSRRTDRVHR